MRYESFYDGYSVDDFLDLLIEYAGFGMGECVNFISEFEDYYNGELVEISYNAGQAIKDGRMPYISTARYLKNGEYHHFAFKDENGERFVEVVPYKEE